MTMRSCASCRVMCFWLGYRRRQQYAIGWTSGVITIAAWARPPGHDDFRDETRRPLAEALKLGCQKRLTGNIEVQHRAIVSELTILALPLLGRAVAQQQRPEHTVTVGKTPIRGRNRLRLDAIHENERDRGHVDLKARHGRCTVRLSACGKPA